MTPSHLLPEYIQKAFQALYAVELAPDQITIQLTRKEFEGDFTVLMFPLARFTGSKPEEAGQQLGEWLIANTNQYITGFNVVKGFLNLSIHDSYWIKYVEALSSGTMENFEDTGERILVEYSSPNTNKPLHLGHVRNILLGWSMANILEKVGNKVFRVQVINDRGIAICKSMLAWQLFGEGETPASTGLKGDFFVGKYYVLFEQKFKAEYADFQQSPDGIALFNNLKQENQDEAAFFAAYKNTYFNEISDLGTRAKSMLIAWEAGDSEVRALWSRMNDWVYEGFQVTYDLLGVGFDKSYYESETYLLGKDITEQGLAKQLFYKKEDGSVWVDLTSRKLDHKILLRSDGTSVYITQDLGTAEERYRDFGANRVIYVVADEQNYHFQVLFGIADILGVPYAKGLYHLSYGMVELPTGRMKSREGTVVDADDLIAEVISEARQSSLEHSDLSSFSLNEQAEIYRRIGLAALKFHIIKVNPRKKMVFDPKESVDMQGHTGPYIQNAYVRVQSILRRTGLPGEVLPDFAGQIQAGERDLLKLLTEYKSTLQMAAAQYDPSLLANYAYQLAKGFHRFYHDFSILKAESPSVQAFRLQIALGTATILKESMHLLGIEMPERM
jgi:arginyl-tRNA synthetase